MLSNYLWRCAKVSYAIKILSYKHLDTNAKDYYIKQIHHLVLLYPYLINLLEPKVFEPHKIDKSIIKRIAQDIYAYGLKKKIYEACSYAIYWAIKYDFDIEIATIKQNSINSLDCIFLMICRASFKRIFGYMVNDQHCTPQRCANHAN